MYIQPFTDVLLLVGSPNDDRNSIAFQFIETAFNKLKIRHLAFSFNWLHSLRHIQEGLSGTSACFFKDTWLDAPGFALAEELTAFKKEMCSGGEPKLECVDSVEYPYLDTVKRFYDWTLDVEVSYAKLVIGKDWWKRKGTLGKVSWAQQERLDS